ncbi:MAG: hypothetical protein ACRCSK_04635 [Fusobacteriaceae bacterium]
MRDIERKIIYFIMDGKAYSDTAIMKNFGLEEEELKEIYANLKNNGYLETYQEFQKKKADLAEDIARGCGSCSSKSCGSCSSGGGGCSKASKYDGIDYSKVLVLTEKILMEEEL